MADDQLERIKKLTIIALVSDDDFMDRLVLKGGNALRLIHKVPVRQSLDLDFSLDGDLGPQDEVQKKIERLLNSTFKPESLAVFDVHLAKAPPNITTDTIGDFWSGYTLEFKVMPQNKYDALAAKPGKRKIQAMELGAHAKRAFTVDFSKHEHCAGKVAHDIDGYRVYVYSELMIVCEKIRALCQQMPAYRPTVKSTSQRPRARDFFDIHYLITNRNVDLHNEQAWETLVRIFEAKRVPLNLLGDISSHRDFHRDNFLAVRDTVDAGITLQDFDFYVDFLVELLRPLQPRWEVNPPSR